MSEEYSDDNDFVDQEEGAQNQNQLNIVSKNNQQNVIVEDATVSPTQIYSDALAQNKFSDNDLPRRNNGEDLNQQQKQGNRKTDSASHEQSNQQYTHTESAQNTNTGDYNESDNYNAINQILQDEMIDMNNQDDQNSKASNQAKEAELAEMQQLKRMQDMQMQQMQQLQQMQAEQMAGIDEEGKPDQMGGNAHNMDVDEEDDQDEVEIIPAYEDMNQEGGTLGQPMTQEEEGDYNEDEEQLLYQQQLQQQQALQQQYQQDMLIQNQQQQYYDQQQQNYNKYQQQLAQQQQQINQQYEQLSAQGLPQQQIQPFQTKQVPIALQYATGKGQKSLTSQQQQQVLRKAMVLDKADKKKNNVELQQEIEELKKLRNKDESDIKLLKVEVSKLEQLFKKYKDIGGFSNPANQGIQLPQRFINSLMQQKAQQILSDIQANPTAENYQQYQQAQAAAGAYGVEGDVIDSAQLLEDMNFVKNQIQCELIRNKTSSTKGNSDYAKFDNFFKQRNLKSMGAQSNMPTSGQKRTSMHQSEMSGAYQKENSNVSQNPQQQSSMRIQINSLKSKCKFLQEQIKSKDDQIQKFKPRGQSSEAGATGTVGSETTATAVTMEEKTRQELRRAHAILKQLRKRINQIATSNRQNAGNQQMQDANPYEQEYQQVISSIQEVLGIKDKAEKTVSVGRVESENINQINKMNGDERRGSQKNEDMDEIKAVLPNQLSQHQKNQKEIKLIEMENKDSLDDLRQKIADLKQELEMSPRQFEDKLLSKLREEIVNNKQQMQAQLKSEIDMESKRMRNVSGKAGSQGPARPGLPSGKNKIRGQAQYKDIQLRQGKK